jgi:hypothetical protein
LRRGYRLPEGKLDILRAAPQCALSKRQVPLLSTVRSSAFRAASAKGVDFSSCTPRARNAPSSTALKTDRSSTASCDTSAKAENIVRRRAEHARQLCKLGEHRRSRARFDLHRIDAGVKLRRELPWIMHPSSRLFSSARRLPMQNGRRDHGCRRPGRAQDDLGAD